MHLHTAGIPKTKRGDTGHTWMRDDGTKHAGSGMVHVVVGRYSYQHDCGTSDWMSSDGDVAWSHCAELRTGSAAGAR